MPNVIYITNVQLLALAQLAQNAAIGFQITSDPSCDTSIDGVYVDRDGGLNHFTVNTDGSTIIG